MLTAQELLHAATHARQYMRRSCRATLTDTCPCRDIMVWLCLQHKLVPLHEVWEIEGRPDRSNAKGRTCLCAPCTSCVLAHPRLLLLLFSAPPVCFSARLPESAAPNRDRNRRGQEHAWRERGRRERSRWQGCLAGFSVCV